MKYKKHFILTSGRCGSNFLANTLNLNPKVVNYGEVLGDWTLLHKLHKPIFNNFNYKKESYLEALYRKPAYFYAAQCYSAYSHLKNSEVINWKTRGQIQTLGLKDFFVNIKSNNLYDFFLESKEISIIHLTRENLLKRLVSAMLMKKVGVVSTKESSQKKDGHIIDIEELKAKLDRDYELNEQENSFAAKLAKTHSFYQLSYESYFSSPETTYEHNSQIFDFLDVENSSVKSNHRKILSQNLADVIKNYDTVESALKGTRYEQFLY